MISNVRRSPIVLFDLIYLIYAAKLRFFCLRWLFFAENVTIGGSKKARPIPEKLAICRWNAEQSHFQALVFQ